MAITLTTPTWHLWSGVWGACVILVGPILPDVLLSHASINRLFWLLSGRILMGFLGPILNYLAVNFPVYFTARIVQTIVASTLFGWVFFWVVANATTLLIILWVAASAPLSASLALLVVLGPIFVLVNLNLVLSLIAMAYGLLTGDWSTFITFDQVVALWQPTLFAFVRVVKRPLDAFLATLSNIRASVAFVRMSIRLMSLPNEIFLAISGQIPERSLNSIRSRHLTLKLWLSVEFFIVSLFFSRVLYVVIIDHFFIWVGFTLYNLYQSRSVLNPVRHAWYLSVCSFLSVTGTRVSEFVSREMANAMISNAQTSLDLSSPGWRVRASRSVNPSQGRVFDGRSDASALTDEDFDFLRGYFLDSFGGILPPFIIFVFLFVVTTLFSMSGKVIHKVFRLPILLFRALGYALIPFFLPDFVYDAFLSGFTLFLVKAFGSPKACKRFFKRFFVLFSVLHTATFNFVMLGEDDPLALQPDDPVVFEKGKILGLKGGSAPTISGIFQVKIVNKTRKALVRFHEMLNDFRLPEMVSGAYRPPSMESMSRTYQTLGDMGFSVLPGFIDSFGSEAVTDGYLEEHASWRKFFMGNTSFALGFRKLKTAFPPWLGLNTIFPQWPGYIHSSTFTGVLEELRSTARYWTGNEDKIISDSEFDDVLDGLWEGTKAQFANSRLASPREIYAKWEKKFNMGFGFGLFHKDGSIRQISRRQVIKSMGGDSQFIKAWEDLFRNARELEIPAPVFTKMETLKLKKAANRAVRTVIGSPFVHHVLTTVFNYKPNHAYAVWDTPAKVGMSLNGVNFNQIWSSLMGHEFIFAGDMTAFDSTQAPPVLKMVAELRKKGFTWHKDFHEICDLIDFSYAKLLTQPMGFKNFGDVFTKAQGFTTGHSSTSADNSLALLVNYLYAWKIVTGMPARDFYSYNTLSNLGDDHVLGYDAVFGWSPEAAMKAMARLGTVMRDEAPGTRSLPDPRRRLPPGQTWQTQEFGFLGKVPLPLTPDILLELYTAGITAKLNFATCHSPSRLNGKATAMNLARAHTDSFKVYNTLLSYIDLTSHNRGLYDEYARRAAHWYQTHHASWISRGMKKSSIKAVPSYNDVLRKWYRGDVNISEPQEDLDRDAFDDDNHPGLIIMEAPDSMAIFVRWLADFPTMLSPRYTNMRWADWLQTKLAARLSWPLALIAHSTGYQSDPLTVKALISKTPYQFLRAENLVVIDQKYSSLIVRHWLFMAYSFIVKRTRYWSMLDFIRMFDSAFINAWFMLTGQVAPIVVELDVHVVETVLVYLLSFVEVDLPFLQPLGFTMPAPSFWIANGLSNMLRYLSPAGSVDFQPLEARVRLLTIDWQASFVLVAPTGVGKSTRMMKRVADVSRLPVVIIVPRHLVAVSVGTYMQEVFPSVRIGIQTEGYTCVGDEPLIYTTVQSFFSTPKLRRPGRIFVIDEAHITEPHYMVIREFLRRTRQRVIHVTSTPLDDVKLDRIVIPAVSSFNVEEIVTSVSNARDYTRFVSARVNDFLPTTRVLIFVPTLSLAADFLALIRRKVCILSSKNRHVDESASVFVATSVLDAGMTLPDVSYVFTMDYDLTISFEDRNIYPNMDLSSPFAKPLRGADQQPELIWFTLSDQTIKQRRGRTGRTCDGIFNLFKVVDQERQKVNYSLTDYFHALRPNISAAIKFFPPHLRGSVTKDLEASLPIWSHVPSYTWTGYEILYQQFLLHNKGRAINNRLTFSEYVNEIVPILSDIKWFHSYVQYRPDEVPQPSVNLPIVPNPEDKARTVLARENLPPFEVADKPIESVEDQPSDRAVFHRINVPGDGLLCGAHALRGLFWSHLRINPTVNLVVHWLRSAVVVDIAGEDHQDNFEFGVIQTVAYRRYRLRVQVSVNGQRPYPLPIDMIDTRHEIATLYLDTALGGGHYNYLGLPAPGHGTDEGLPPPFDT